MNAVRTGDRGRAERCGCSEVGVLNVLPHPHAEAFERGGEDEARGDAEEGGVRERRRETDGVDGEFSCMHTTGGEEREENWGGAADGVDFDSGVLVAIGFLVEENWGLGGRREVHEVGRDKLNDCFRE